MIQGIVFDERGLVPAVAQDDRTGQVLMLAYMNAESLEETLSTGYVHYFSRSRDGIWKKGETSGHVQRLKALHFDCDLDAVLVRVEQEGVACHTGRPACFFHTAGGGIEETGSAGPWFKDGVLRRVYDVILSRKEALESGRRDSESYVQSLLSAGITKILEKVDEETAEVVAAATKGEAEELTREIADLWFHVLVLLGSEDIHPEAVFSELERRFGKSGIQEKRGRKIK
ncbi:MAG: bifunctional phosphoribosyl-AMP cyclohydrolase/phosphoribosyl-ATP diphosphatase HisIE [Nitrospinota bacterium]